jgi:hypothetical protein
MSVAVSNQLGAGKFVWISRRRRELILLRQEFQSDGA